MKSPTKDGTAESPFARPVVDWPTLALLAVMWAGLLGNLAWALTDPPGLARLVLHVLIGVFFLNLSFTVWHEGVHDTVFRSRVGNDIVGILGTYPAMLQYFLIRRVHHLHHEHTNDPERDPDVWFLEGSIWTLPLRYPRGMRRAHRMWKSTNPPAWEAAVDLAFTLTIPLVLALAWWKGALVPVLACWVVPKLIAMWIHAWYVNWLPHRELTRERFRNTRIFPIGWLAPLMVCHNYHGLHHAWQSVPWHRYGDAFRLKRELLEQRGAPIKKRLLEL